LICIALKVRLHLPGRTTLKEKRRTLRAIVDGMAPRFGAAVAEVGDNDAPERAELAFAVVGGSSGETRQRAAALLERLRERPDLNVVHVARSECSPEDEL
jgi:uncharacterized protein YlxP (DUF503 family)